MSEVKAMLAGLDMVHAALGVGAAMPGNRQEPCCGNCGWGEMLTGSGYVRCSAPIPESANVSGCNDRSDVKSNDGDDCPAWKAKGEA